MGEKILRACQVSEKVGLSRASIYRLMGQGEFPVQLSLGARSVGWLESEVDHWLEQRIENREVRVRHTTVL